MRREIRRLKPRQDSEKKRRGKRKGRRKVINNLNKYNWSKRDEETKTNGGNLRGVKHESKSLPAARRH